MVDTITTIGGTSISVIHTEMDPAVISVLPFGGAGELTRAVARRLPPLPHCNDPASYSQAPMRGSLCAFPLKKRVCNSTVVLTIHLKFLLRGHAAAL